MRIAFDLDDTLIPHDPALPRELPTLLARCTTAEPLRRGTVELLRSIRKLGGEVWIYTTSMRSPLEIRWLFLTYGVWLRGVVNQYCHQSTMIGPLEAYRHCSKYPPAFGIDSRGDALRWRRLQNRPRAIRVLRIEPADEQWAHRVSEVVRTCLGK